MNNHQRPNGGEQQTTALRKKRSFMILIAVVVVGISAAVAATVGVVMSRSSSGGGGEATDATTQQEGSSDPTSFRVDDDGKMVPSPMYSSPFEFLSTDPDGIHLNGLKATSPNANSMSILARRLPFTMKWLGPYIYEDIMDDDLWQTVCAVDIGSPGYIYVRGRRNCFEDDRSTLNINQGYVYVAHMRLLPDGVVWWKETPDKVIISWENATKSMDQNDLNSIERHDPDDTRRLYINAQIHLYASGQITLCYGPSNWADINNGDTTHLVGVSAVTNGGNDGFCGATGEPYFWKGDGEFLPRYWPANMCQDYWLDRNAPNTK